MMERSFSSPYDRFRRPRKPSRLLDSIRWTGNVEPVTRDEAEVALASFCDLQRVYEAVAPGQPSLTITTLAALVGLGEDPRQVAKAFGADPGDAAGIARELARAGVRCTELKALAKTCQGNGELLEKVSDLLASIDIDPTEAVYPNPAWKRPERLKVPANRWAIETPVQPAKAEVAA